MYKENQKLMCIRQGTAPEETVLPVVGKMYTWDGFIKSYPDGFTRIGLKELPSGWHYNSDCFEEVDETFSELILQDLKKEIKDSELKKRNNTNSKIALTIIGLFIFSEVVNFFVEKNKQ